MSIGSWQPEPQSLNTLNHQQIDPLLEKLAADDESLAWLAESLDWVEPLAKAEKKAWAELSIALETSQLISLIHFFTRLEKEQNWDLGDKSPVIPLFKQLKKSEGLDRELVQWVKSHTNNKFLPFGPLL